MWHLAWAVPLSLLALGVFVALAHTCEELSRLRAENERLRAGRGP